MYAILLRYFYDLHTLTPAAIHSVCVYIGSVTKMPPDLSICIQTVDVEDHDEGVKNTPLVGWDRVVLRVSFGERNGFIAALLDGVNFRTI